MNTSLSLEQLWQAAPVVDRRFQPEELMGYPEVVQRYLNHAIAPGTQLASAVRLQMHGEIKLNRWIPFQAEQVICWERGMIWQAVAWMNGLPIRGFDRLVDGVGAMRWKLLGLIPVVTATGPDVTRSAIGRMQGECMWLPSVFCDRTQSWTAPDTVHAQAHLPLLGETAEICLTVNNAGRLEGLSFQRWGNPEGADHHYVNFGGIVERESTFSGYTIPTQLKAGWYFGSDRFEPEGEFFRVTIDQALYR